MRLLFVLAAVISVGAQTWGSQRAVNERQPAHWTGSHSSETPLAGSGIANLRLGSRTLLSSAAEPPGQPSSAVSGEEEAEGEDEHQVQLPVRPPVVAPRTGGKTYTIDGGVVRPKLLQHVMYAACGGIPRLLPHLLSTELCQPCTAHCHDTQPFALLAGSGGGGVMRGVVSPRWTSHRFLTFSFLRPHELPLLLATVAVSGLARRAQSGDGTPISLHLSPALSWRG